MKKLILPRRNAPLKYIRFALTAILMLLILSHTAFADESDIPSLFAGDEAWYKDSVSPLVVREGVYFIPADLLAMMDGISVSSTDGNNILIHSAENDRYLSILFMQRSAAVNGKIIDDIRVFRNGDTFYLDAGLAADALDLICETAVLENGSSVLRISDDSRIFTIDELIAVYLPKNETAPDEDEITELPVTEEDLSYNGKMKRIYVLVKSPKNGDATEFPALRNCLLYGVRFTRFLDEDDSVDDMLLSGAMGCYGIVSNHGSSSGALDSLNEKIMSYTRKSTRFTLSDGNDENDRVLRENGYIPISPDFTVNGSSNPDVLLTEIINYIGSTGSCTLLLEDCWNSERMAILLSELANSLYSTANLSDHSFGTSTERK